MGAGGWWLLMVGALVGDGTELTFEWTAPAACPDQAAAHRAVLAAIDRPLAARDVPLLALEAAIQQLPAGGYAAVLTFRSAAGASERRLSAPSCSALVDATAIIVALALDREAQQSAARPTVTSTRSVVRARRRVPPTPRSWFWRVAVGVSGAVGGLPTPSGAVSARVAARGARFSLGIGAHYRWPRRLVLSEPEAGVTFSVLAGTLRGCWLPVTGRVALDVCAGAEVGWLSAAGFGVSDPETVHQLWLAGWGEAAPSLALDDQWRLRTRIRGLVPIRRPSFRLEPSSDRFRISTFSADVILELALNFR